MALIKTEKEIAWGSNCVANTTTNFSIESVYEKYKRNKIDLNVLCQRGEVWNEEQKNGLWETLLLKHSISQIHAAKTESESGLKWVIYDGKQRLSTIFQILDNKLPLKMNRVRTPELKQNLIREFSKTKEGKQALVIGKIYFKDFDNITQDIILQSDLTVATYEGLSEDDGVALFKRLNSNTDFTTSQKIINHNISLRKNYINKLLLHPVINTIFTTRVGTFNYDNQEKTLLQIFCICSGKEYPNNPTAKGEVSPGKILTEVESYRGPCSGDAEEITNKTREIAFMFDTLENIKWEKIIPRKSSFSYFLAFLSLYYNGDDTLRKNLRAGLSNDEFDPKNFTVGGGGESSDYFEKRKNDILAEVKRVL